MSEDEFRYNDDLLIKPDQLERAKNEFSDLFRALHHESLQTWFNDIDPKANRAKRIAGHAGTGAVILAVVSLCGGATERIWHEEGLASTILTIFFAILGLAAVAVSALGLIWGDRKHEWLLNRLRTERMRQFHFQGIVWSLPEIIEWLKTSDASKFEAHRETAFADFKNTYQNKAEASLTSILHPDGVHESWLHGDPEKLLLALPDGDLPQSIEKAYQKLRFNVQLEYVNYILRESGTSWRLSKMPLRQKQKFLRALWLLPFVALVIIHVYILGCALLGAHGEWLQWLHSVGTCFALVALGVRTLEHGLAIPTHIERFEEYRANLKALNKRFSRALTARQKVEVMIELECVAFEEMRSFLRTEHEASVVL